MEKYNFVSFSGIFMLILIAWLFSSDKRNINWRVILWGVLIQIGIAAFVFIVPAGTRFFLFLNDAAIKVMGSASAGARFVFGRLALSPGETGEAGETSLGFILAFQAFPTILFFSSLISILYYFNIMQRVVRAFAYVFTKLMRISGAESLVTASNIFAGVESALTVRPYLAKMTRSELCLLLTAGMATVSSNILALYVYSLKAELPTIAGHLISASLLAAPAAVVMSKVMLPEGDSPETLGVHIRPYYERESSAFEAVINGANQGLKMIAGIVALLIAVLGLVALFELLLAALGNRINLAFGWHFGWSLKELLGYLFYPLTLIIGIPPSDAGVISKIIAERNIVTEVVAYRDLAGAISKGLLVHPRSAVITVYALCGFAHLASMAIFVGGTAALVPGKTREIASVAVRALVAATLACLMTACVAGTFFGKASILFG
ncbi:MAG: nucleoside transporter C-terminal domain-containing protein [Candidatus Omnitrophica bacterium]|nr:nucleoside transporter C-terminal domain-containing protein [Candidatus Omnitrophota bacterium]MDD5670770.1 nucleoside transporter C-terminal domain-containing protein [Candidatus Omnitrophota bacterium]